MIAPSHQVQAVCSMCSQSLDRRQAFRHMMLALASVSIPGCALLSPLLAGARDKPVSGTSEPPQDLPAYMHWMNEVTGVIAATPYFQQVLGALNPRASTVQIASREVFVKQIVTVLFLRATFVDLDPTDRARPAIQAHLWSHMTAFDDAVRAVDRWLRMFVRVQGKPELLGSLDPRSYAGERVLRWLRDADMQFHLSPKRRLYFDRARQWIVRELLQEHFGVWFDTFFVRYVKLSAHPRDAGTSVGARMLGITSQMSAGGLRLAVLDAEHPVVSNIGAGLLGLGETLLLITVITALGLPLTQDSPFVMER